jgi:threonine aldolase
VLSDLSQLAGKDGAAADVYGTGEWLQAFEAEVAAALGKPCGRFMPTGVCAQMAALAVYADLPARRSAVESQRSFVCHETSHLLLWESDAARDLLGLVPLIAGNDRPMAAADLERVLKRQFAVGVPPSAIIVRLVFLYVAGFFLPHPIPSVANAAFSPTAKHPLPDAPAR